MAVLLQQASSAIRLPKNSSRTRGTFPPGAPTTPRHLTSHIWPLLRKSHIVTPLTLAGEQNRQVQKSGPYLRVPRRQRHSKYSATPPSYQKRNAFLNLTFRCFKAQRPTRERHGEVIIESYLAANRKRHGENSRRFKYMKGGRRIPSLFEKLSLARRRLPLNATMSSECTRRIMILSVRVASMSLKFLREGQPILGVRAILSNCAIPNWSLRPSYSASASRCFKINKGERRSRSQTVPAARRIACAYTQRKPHPVANWAARKSTTPAQGRRRHYGLSQPTAR